MATFVAALVCLGLLFLLSVIIRFSFIRPARAKGWRERLGRPEMSEVESKWGIRLPESMEKYYRGEIVTRSDFYLAPRGSTQSEWLYIERFVPLTCRDISEWAAITNVPGIPIAIDASKGTYYVPFEPLRQQLSAPVLLRLPGRKHEERKVAASFDEFGKFEPKDVPEEE